MPDREPERDRDRECGGELAPAAIRVLHLELDHAADAVERPAHRPVEGGPIDLLRVAHEARERVRHARRVRDADEVARAVAELLAEELPPSRAAKVGAAILGVPKSTLYDLLEH